MKEFVHNELPQQKADMTTSNEPLTINIKLQGMLGKEDTPESSSNAQKLESDQSHLMTEGIPSQVYSPSIKAKDSGGIVETRTLDHNFQHLASYDYNES